MNDKVHIVYATDDGYLVPTMVAMASAVKYASEKEALVFHILDTGISEDKWEHFASRVNDRLGSPAVVRHVIDPKAYASFKAWHGSYGAYARLDIPDLMSDVDWCVYADGDTLFNEDPLKLREVFDADYALQGHDDWHEGMPEITVQAQWFIDQGLGWDPEQYVCSGFLIMNLAEFRERQLGRKCLEFIRDYPTINYPDQDALSYVCRDQIKLLPDEWGRFSWNAFHDEKRGCLHFASDLPWKLMTNLYMDYNDAHKAWFDCAREMLGFEMRDVLVSPFKRSVYLKKRLMRAFCRGMILLVPKAALRRIGFYHYLNRHYQF